MQERHSVEAPASAVGKLRGEREVIIREMFAAGANDQEIASRLDLSTKRIEAIRQEIGLLRSRGPAWRQPGWTPPPVPSRTADQAAQHLRRFYPRVCRARTIDPQEPDYIWLLGDERVNEDRLIKRAEKHGFDPMGWL